MPCQVCGHTPLHDVISLGYMPSPNRMRKIDEEATSQTWYPTDLMLCPRCELVQLNYIADRREIFPPDYTYVSGTTKALRNNFADLYNETLTFVDREQSDLVVDIGSNDGTLLSNFIDNTTLGVEPTDAADIANSRGITTIKKSFNLEVARRIKAQHGPAKLITCTNCFAHVDNIHNFIEGVLKLLASDGIFVTESHYLPSLIKTLQYDTIYHEHLRYYSLTSLKYLLEMHGLSIFHYKQIPSHGGSIRVYAATNRPKSMFTEQTTKYMLASFQQDVILSKLHLLHYVTQLKEKGARIAGIGAPSRATTLINFVGLDETIIDYICEVPNSPKIGRYIPGTQIPVVDEAKLYLDQPDYALIFSWHIANELIPELRANGFRGQIFTPLPDIR